MTSDIIDLADLVNYVVTEDRDGKSLRGSSGAGKIMVNARKIWSRRFPKREVSIHGGNINLMGGGCISTSVPLIERPRIYAPGYLKNLRMRNTFFGARFMPMALC